MPDLLNKPFDYFLYDHVTNFCWKSLSSFEQLLKSVGYDVIHIKFTYKG